MKRTKLKSVTNANLLLLRNLHKSASLTQNQLIQNQIFIYPHDERLHSINRQFYTPWLYSR